MQPRIALVSQGRPEGKSAYARFGAPSEMLVFRAGGGQRFTDGESPDLQFPSAFGNVTVSLSGREG